MINQINLNGERFYTYLNYKILSVTTLLSKFEDKTGLNKWKQKLGESELTVEEKNHLFCLSEYEQNEYIKQRGEFKANKIRDEAAEFGTVKHGLIELFFIQRQNKSEEVWKTLLPKYYSFISEIQPIYLEKKIVYVKNNKGYGGTLDCFAKIHHEFFLDQDENIINLKDKNLIIDWKNTNKTKYLIGKAYGSFYYPIIKYAFQLAAYRQGLLFLQPNLQIDGGLIYLVPKDKVNKVYLYYFDLEHLDWYFQGFEEIIDCYYNQTFFDWNNFANKTFLENKLGKSLTQI